jgi:hypothetical protein
VTGEASCRGSDTASRDRVTTAINRWIGHLFDPLHRREIVDTLFEADDTFDRHAERRAQLRDRVGDIGLALGRAEAEERRQLYESLRLSLIYHHAEQIVDVEIDPLADRVDKYRVRGATHTLTTRIELPV